MLGRHEVFDVSGQKYTFALARGFGFGDECFAVWFCFFLSVLGELLFEVAELCWKKPSLREKLIFVGKCFLHAVKIARQVILASKCVHAWEVVDSLIWLHTVQFLDLHLAISPKNVPFVLLIFILWVVRGVTETHLE